jgi:hypothetical protein
MTLTGYDMQMLDTVFEAIFARWRRELGDSNLDSAWRRAANRVSAYLLFPIAAATVVLTAVVYRLMGTGTFTEHKRLAQIVGVAIWFAISALLDRRFRKYLLNLPPLSESEPARARRYVFGFQVTCIAVFILACLSGYFLHEGGIRLL